MKSQDILNFKRLGHLIINDIKLLSKVTFLIIISILILRVITQPFNIYSIETFFYMLNIGGFIISINAFYELQEPGKAHFYFMLPCSNLERFLSKWLLVSFLYPLLTFTIFILFFSWYTALINIFSYALWLGIIKYGIFQSILLLGAATFRKYALFKTVIVTGVFYITLYGFALITDVILFYLKSSHRGVFEKNLLMINQLFFWFLLAPCCLILTYQQIKKFQLK